MGLKRERCMISNCLPLIICDHVWMLRDKARLGEDPGTVPELVLKIQTPFNETQNAWLDMGGVKQNVKDLGWSPPHLLSPYSSFSSLGKS